METIQLKDGNQIPKIGLGVCMIPDLEECERVVVDAIDAGYRLIDTAAIYENEEAVGNGIRKSGIKRDELFITSKLWVDHNSYEGARTAIAESLEKLQTDYVDLYMIHWPIGDYYGAYRALVEAQREGKIRSIGISNFQMDQLMDLLVHQEVKPVINQMQCNPFIQQNANLSMITEQGLVMEAYSPFAVGKDNIFQNEVLTSIGEKYHKSAAQVILRWDIERGVIAIPKSVHKERMVQNLDVFDFSLSQEDMDQISALDRQEESAEIQKRLKHVMMFTQPFGK